LAAIEECFPHRLKFEFYVVSIKEKQRCKYNVPILTLINLALGYNVRSIFVSLR